MISHIYALISPLSSEIRYIGKTVIPSKRLAMHISDKSDTYKTRWIRSIISKGFLPEMIILESIFDPDQNLWQHREIYWIDIIRKSGARLTNAKAGGTGGLIPSEDVKAKLIASFSESRRQKIIDSNKRRAGLPTKPRGPLSDLHRAKLRASFTPERLAAQSLARKGIKRSADAISKTAAKMRGRKQSPETCAKKSAAWTPEKKAEFSRKITGRKNTPEVLAKMSAVAIAGERWKNFSTSTKNKNV